MTYGKGRYMHWRRQQRMPNRFVNLHQRRELVVRRASLVHREPAAGRRRYASPPSSPVDAARSGVSLSWS